MQRRPKGRKQSNKKRGGQPSVSQLLSRATSQSISGISQAITRMAISGSPHLLTNTVTTGVLQYVLKLDPNADIENFSTRFGADYEEVRCLGAKVRINPLAGVSNGISAYWVDEKYASVPTLTESTGKTVGWIQHSSSADRAKSLTWKPNDIADSSFVVATAGSIGNAAYFKVYTNNAQYNAPIVATSLFMVQVTYVLEFRGIQE